jgi:hypothetical protein
VVEKRYRNNLNDAIQELKSTLPVYKVKANDPAYNPVIDGPLPEEQVRDNKTAILRNAIDYIAHLRTVSEQLMAQNAELINLSRALGGGDQLDQLLSSYQPWYIYWRSRGEKKAETNSPKEVLSRPAVKRARGNHSTDSTDNHWSLKSIPGSKMLACISAALCVILPTPNEESSHGAAPSLFGRSLHGILDVNRFASVASPR